jgi:hypothetical protein
VVPPTAFRGEDGSWRCADRGYNEAVAGFVGDVLFAQSTQATEEVQAFVPGAAILVPARSVVVGGVHLLNATPSAIDTSLAFDFETIDEADVTTVLSAMSFTNNDLEIAPRAESRHRMACDLDETYQREMGHGPDFKIYYVLPHYHALGNYFRLELVGGDNDGMVIFETGAAIGDPLGASLDPPVEVRGATAIRMTCGFDNPRDEWVRYGIGDQEMCVVLAFTDAQLKLLGVADTGTALGRGSDGIWMNTGNCRAYGVIDF